MSEKEELARLVKRRKQIEAKYGKIAKRRLTKLNQLIAPNLDLMDMNDADFNNFINQIVAMINKNGGNQQQNNQKNRG